MPSHNIYSFFCYTVWMQTNQLSLPASALSQDYVRQFLINRAELLQAEEPEHAFRTGDPYNIVIRNKSGTDVYGELFHGHILFFFPVPGVLERLEYQGLRLPHPNPLNYYTHFTTYADGTWGGFGRRSQADVPLEDVTFGLDIYGANVTIRPFGPDIDIAQKLQDAFRKYYDFERTAAKKSRTSKKYYDLGRYVRRLTGRLPEQRLLLQPPTD